MEVCVPVCANDPQKVTDLEAASLLSAGLHGLLLGCACHFLTNRLRSCYYLSSPDQAYLPGIQTRNPSGHPPDSTEALLSSPLPYRDSTQDVQRQA